jgi:RNA polymerase sigma factor (sigma-70 family)
MTAVEFTHQIARLRATLKLFTRRFTSDREESSDLVQDTLLKALMHKDKFTQGTNLKGWLFIIMRNTFINNYRRNQHTKILRDHTKDLYFLNVEDRHTFNCPDSRYEYFDIWKNVNQLRDELLIPFKMYTSGHKYHEIADHLQLPIGTVKNRIFHARKEIRKKLTGYSLTS